MTPAGHPIWGVLVILIVFIRRRSFNSMSSAIQVAGQVAGQSLSQWTPEQVNLIKSQVAYPEITNDELALFGQVCNRTGLDPFARQIYAIGRKVKNQETGEKTLKMTIQVSIDGMRLAAVRSNLYGGSETFWCGSDGIWHDVWLSNETPSAAKTIVYRIGSNSPFVGVAKFDSYKQTYYGKLSDLWAKMPDVMIGKCSEALALRKAFPAELSGLYSKEEMQQTDDGDRTPSVPMATPDQAKMVKTLRERANLNQAQIVAVMQERFGVSQWAQMTRDNAESLIESLEATIETTVAEVEVVA